LVGRATIAICLAVCALGCGSPDKVARPKTVACPEGTPALKAREVIGPVPRGYEVLPPERRKPIDRFVARLRRQTGSKGYLNHDASVIYRRGEVDGTVVVVINTSEGTPEDVVAGAKSAERDRGVDGERLDIDGREGRLQRADDGSFIALAPTGQCSMLILIALEKPMLEEAAGLIGARR
jgi:hypothetical protein